MTRKDPKWFLNLILNREGLRHEENLDRAELNKLSEQVIDVCITVHKLL